MNKSELLLKISTILSKNNIRILSISTHTQLHGLPFYVYEKIPEKLISSILEEENLFVEEIKNILYPSYFRYSVRNIEMRK